MNTAVNMNGGYNMNQAVNMNGGYDMNQAVNMNGGYNMNQATNMNGGYNMNQGANMNNIVYFNGANNMNYMNNSYMGGYVNNELVEYLNQGVRIFKDYEAFMEKYNQDKEELEEIQKAPEKVAKKWKWITIGGPIILPLFIPVPTVGTFLIAGGLVAATQYAKKNLIGKDNEKAMAKYYDATARIAALEEQKEQLVNHISSTFGYVQEEYRSSYIMSYMLDLARAGRIHDMNQGYMLADEELHRLAVEATQLAMMEEQKEAAASAAVTGAVVAGTASLLGSFLGSCWRD